MTELPATEARSSGKVDSGKTSGASTSKDGGNSEVGSSKRRVLFRRSSRASAHGSTASTRTNATDEDELEHGPMSGRGEEYDGNWNVGDEMKMGFG